MATKQTGKPTGRPAFVPTDAQRNLAMVLRSNGIPPAIIALEVGISLRTLYSKFSDEMENGKERMVAKIGAKLTVKAMAANTTCMIFYLKTHGGPEWSEKGRAPEGGDEGGFSSTSPPAIVRVLGGFGAPE